MHLDSDEAFYEDLHSLGLHVQNYNPKSPSNLFSCGSNVLLFTGKNFKLVSPHTSFPLLCLAPNPVLDMAIKFDDKLISLLVLEEKPFPENVKITHC